jgi:hypothetical protein
MDHTAGSGAATVVYESMFGNTEMIAEKIAEGLRANGWQAAALDVRSTEALPPDIDLLVLGAPTHAFSLSRPQTRADAVRRGADPARGDLGLREWLTGLGRATESSPAVATFDTRASAVRRLPASAGRTLTRLARHRGYRIIDRPQGFLVADTDGPLLSGELERAAAWGRQLGTTFR